MRCDIARDSGESRLNEYLPEHNGHKRNNDSIARIKHPFEVFEGIRARENIKRHDTHDRHMILRFTKEYDHF